VNLLFEFEFEIKNNAANLRASIRTEFCFYSNSLCRRGGRRRGGRRGARRGPGEGGGRGCGGRLIFSRDFVELFRTENLADAIDATPGRNEFGIVIEPRNSL
jgi:hypothetical protein